MENTKILPSLTNLPKSEDGPMYKKYTKDQMKDIIDQNCGIISLILLKTGYNYKQIYNCLDKYKLRDYLTQAKQNLVSKAEKVLFDNLDSENPVVQQRAAETVLKSKFAQEQGWNQTPSTVIQQNISTDNKEIQIKNIFGIQ